MWITYRFKGGQEPSMAEMLKRAVVHFYHHAKHLPTAVRVNPKRVETATAALRELKLQRLPVMACGGTLANEVWLKVM